MEGMCLLYNSYYCRLCAEQSANGANLYMPLENQSNLSQLVNKYLPIKVAAIYKFYIEDDGMYPRKICPGCHIQLEATKSFMELIIEGQIKLRELYSKQKETLSRQEAQKLQLQQALHSVNPTSSVETYTIQSDETGEKFFIQIFSEGPLFPPNHELSLHADSIIKPRRKRGRPPKLVQAPPNEEKVEEVIAKNFDEEVNPEPETNARKKRKIKIPSRYQEALQGKELDKIFTHHDEEDLKYKHESDIECVSDELNDDQIMGRMESKDETNEEPMLHNCIKSKIELDSGGTKECGTYECEICKKKFEQLKLYQLHIRAHKQTYICPDANGNVKNSETDAAELHQTENGHEDLAEFEKIDLIGTLEVPAASVERTEEDPLKGVEQHRCHQCNKNFSCKQNYEVHYRAIHNQEKPFVCDKCNKRFSYANSLRLHVMRHSKGYYAGQYACTACSKTFSNPSSLWYHRDSAHGNGRKFVCIKCNKTFKHRQLLQRHQLVHSDARPHQCTHCKAAFKTRSNLVNHEAIHTGVRKYCCTECGHSFAHRTSLTLHQRWHAGQKPYQCDVCQKTFSQKGNLAEHRRIHTGEKPYCCDHCGRSFTTSSQFKLHRKRHTGERPWQCEYCAKTFLHKDTWKCHTRRHLNDRPFKCRHCERAFTESWALKKHERLHSGERPYRCDQCNRSFSDTSNLSKHRRIHLNAAAPTEDLEAFVHIKDSNRDPLQLHQLVDEQGNPISLTTQDGQQVRVVTETDDQENIQGLLPDGTLIPIDLATVQEDPNHQQITVEAEETLSSSNDISYVSPDIDGSSRSEEGKLNANIHFLSDKNGEEVCLVTTYAMDQDAINSEFLSIA